VSCASSYSHADSNYVSSIKVDPYLNVDAGTMNPKEHGEVFVLDDGGEVDLDVSLALTLLCMLIS